MSTENAPDSTHPPSPPSSPELSPLRCPPISAWRSLQDLQLDGIPHEKVLGIEKFFASCGVDAYVAGYTVGTKSRIVRMRGQCFICRRTHHSNHWVLINTPGFLTTRIRCHACLEVQDIKKLDF
jgi:hypothetical protein